jgi:hypothetical protein
MNTTAPAKTATHYAGIIRNFMSAHPDGNLLPVPVSVGGGEWTIEVSGLYYTMEYDQDAEDTYIESHQVPLFELIGSNGTQDEEPADLWEKYAEIVKQAMK